MTDVERQELLKGLKRIEEYLERNQMNQMLTDIRTAMSYVSSDISTANTEATSYVPQFVADNIFQIIQLETGYTKEDLSGKIRSRKLVDARMIFTKLMLEFCPGIPLIKLGKMIHRDHTTIINQRENADEFLSTDKDFREKFILIRKMVLESIERKTT